MGYDAIVDCYTDEPSGLGVPPYLGVHQRYIAGWLSQQGIDYRYLTVDDLRASTGERYPEKAVCNHTRNAKEVQPILEGARKIYVVSGAFVEYEYVSAVPPRISEIKDLLAPYTAEKILFYALGTDSSLIPAEPFFSTVVTGLAYNYLIHGQMSSFAANYHELREVAVRSAELLDQIPDARIIELESGSGCRRRPGCSFCIENKRGLPPTYRAPDDIREEVRQLAAHGALYFRVGRQPSFYSYMGSDSDSVRRLLDGIREAAPDLRVLHIDNVDPSEVITANGRGITQAIVNLCTSGNIAPFGVESFDQAVRTSNNLNGTVSEIHEAIGLLNSLGSERGATGLPKFLPGINIIHGLQGQSAATLDANLEHLERILADGLMVRRLFVRGLTDTCGVTVESTMSEAKTDGLAAWQHAIHARFNEPMLKRVVPVGTVLTDAVCEIRVGEGSLLRQLGTCPVRILLPAVNLPLGASADVSVDGYRDWRTVTGHVHV